MRDGAVAGYGVRRRCRERHKLGPLFAPDAGGPGALLDGLVADLGLVRARGLLAGLRTARMYRGPAPDYDRSFVFGVTTLELG